MKRRSIFKTLAALFLGRKCVEAGTVVKPTSDIEQLEEEYAKACNALSRYRESHGFEPDVRVRCQFRDEPPKTGTIAPYGDAWGSCSKWCVPVLLDAGYRQPWMMSSLTLIVSE